MKSPSTTKPENVSTPGSVFTVDAETFHDLNERSLGFAPRKYPLGVVLDDFRRVAKQLGHFPTRVEYMNAGKCFHSLFVRMLGFREIARRIGMVCIGRRKKTLAAPRQAYLCFNQEECVNNPPATVSTKQTYCHDCKIERGWND